MAGVFTCLLYIVHLKLSSYLIHNALHQHAQYVSDTVAQNVWTHNIIIL